jgi:hypothetical protein
MHNDDDSTIYFGKTSYQFRLLIVTPFDLYWIVIAYNNNIGCITFVWNCSKILNFIRLFEDVMFVYLSFRYHQLIVHRMHHSKTPINYQPCVIYGCLYSYYSISDCWNWSPYKLYGAKYVYSRIWKYIRLFEHVMFVYSRTTYYQRIAYPTYHLETPPNQQLHIICD